MSAVTKKHIEDEIHEPVGDQCIAAVMQKVTDGVSEVQFRVFEVKLIRLQFQM